jgi:hypothetical protein
VPSAAYHRKQAQLCAKLAVGSTDPTVVSISHVMLLEHLAKAEELEPSVDPIGWLVAADGRNHMERD